MRGSIVVKAGLAIAGLLMAGAAWAQMPGGGPGDPPDMGRRMGPGPGMDGHRPPMERAFVRHGIEGRWWSNPRIAERLKLTDAQKKEFDSILLDHQEKLIDLRANVEKAELEMKPLISADQPNETQILAQIDKVAMARAELEKANARYLLAIRSKLTPEQWKMVQDFREDRGMQRGEWRGRGPMQGRQGWRKGGPQGGTNGAGTPPPAQAGPPPGDE
jgi:periplasmic protein CpxP/Spy